MRVITKRSAVTMLGGTALAALLALGGCAPEGMQARAEARGTSQPLGSLANDNFGGRSQTPGYLYDRGGSNAGASLLPRGDGPFSGNV